MKRKIKRDRILLKNGYLFVYISMIYIIVFSVVGIVLWLLKTPLDFSNLDFSDKLVLMIMFMFITLLLIFTLDWDAEMFTDKYIQKRSIYYIEATRIPSVIEHRKYNDTVFNVISLEMQIGPIGSGWSVIYDFSNLKSCWKFYAKEEAQRVINNIKNDNIYTTFKIKEVKHE